MALGTILVDLEEGQVVDVIGESSAGALATWLAAHPGITIISRDRQGEYADGARRAIPKVTQVADRFHLIRNLRQAVERELAVHRRELRVSLSCQGTAPPNPQGKKEPRVRRTCSPAVKYDREAVEQRRREKLQLFQTIQQMRGQGIKVSELARRLGINRRRIDKWVRLKELPERSRMQPRPGKAESFREYLWKRWEEGCHHGRELFAEIQAMGYTGCYSRLAKVLSPWRQPKCESGAGDDVLPALLDEASPAPTRAISPQVAASLLSKSRPELTARQAEIVDQLKEQCPGYTAMRRLSMGFRCILCQGKVKSLHRWLEKARKTRIHPLESLVRTVKQDLAAVEAVVTEKWSNGPVEGHINRLKTLKRQMYGRAGVELLRARVLPLPVLDTK